MLKILTMIWRDQKPHKKYEKEKRKMCLLKCVEGEKQSERIRTAER